MKRYAFMDGDVLPFETVLTEKTSPLTTFRPEPTLPKVFLIDEDVVSTDAFQPITDHLGFVNGFIRY